MARIILPLTSLRDTVVERLAELRRSYKREEELYQQAQVENEAWFKENQVAFSLVFSYLIRAYERAFLGKLRFSPPKATPDSIVFSVQPNEETRDSLKKVYPQFLYRWIEHRGHLGTITIPKKNLRSKPQKGLIKDLEDFLERLPMHNDGNIEIEVDVLKRLGINYDHKQIIRRFEEL